MRIGIDLMGGDTSPFDLYQAVLLAAEQLKTNCSLIAIATKSVVEKINATNPTLSTHSKHASIGFHLVDDTIAMADDPLGAVRHKRGASLVVGMRLLKKKQLDALISCGNTGALIASAALSLPMLPGIKRPALLATLPTEKGTVLTLDVGGNVACKAVNLVEFAYLGAAYRRNLFPDAIPRVGLLNVGIESKKGPVEVRQAYELLKRACEQEKKPRLDFVGNVEGGDIFKGVVDVVVTDGFTGNTLLKTAEGIAAFIFGTLEKILHLDAPPEFEKALGDLNRQFNYNEYPGAMVCGVEGLVIKVHGQSSPQALLNSIIGATEYLKNDFIAQVKAQLASLESSYNSCLARSMRAF